MPLHRAAYWDHEDVVDILLRHGSCLTSRNNVSSNNTLCYNIHYVVVLSVSPKAR